MKHLRNLARLDKATAALDGLMALGALAGTLALAVWALTDERWIDALLFAAAGGFATLMLICGAAFFAVLGNRISEGRWRLAQTVAAALWLGAWPPFGLLIGGYMLWVCWVHPPTRDHLADRPGDLADRPGDGVDRG